MPATIFIRLNQKLFSLRKITTPLQHWYGHRVFRVDGSKITVPRGLLAENHEASNHDQYDPQGRLSTRYHLGSGLIYDGMLVEIKASALAYSRIWNTCNQARCLGV